MIPFAASLLALGLATGFQARAHDATRGHFNGDVMARGYSPLDQITPENGGGLEVA